MATKKPRQRVKPSPPKFRAFPAAAEAVPAAIRAAVNKPWPVEKPVEVTD